MGLNLSKGTSASYLGRGWASEAAFILILLSTTYSVALILADIEFRCGR